MSTANPATPEQSPIPETKPTSAPPAEKPPAETEADRIEAARKAAREEALAEAKAERDREKAAADKKAAEEQGEFQKLYEAEKKAREESEHLLQIQRKDTTLTDYLAAEHPDYLPRKKYIAPLIAAGLKGDALIKAVKDAVGEFVKDNPITPKPKPGGAPPAAPAGGRVPAGRSPNQRTSTAGVASSRF